MPKTLKEIALELNTSVSTVSRVVNHKDNVNEATRARILKALKNLDYKPNQIARSLKKNSTSVIGIIVPDIRERFFCEIIRGVDTIVSEYGYSILLVDSNENADKEEQYLDLLFQQRVDALIIATVTSGRKVLQYLEHRIPVVFIDNLPKIDVPYDAILLDNVQASKMAMNLLIGKGYTRIGIIAGTQSETTGFDRLLGYRLALAEAHIEVDEQLITYGNNKEETGYQCMEKLILQSKNAPVEAVFSTAEGMTYGAIKAMQDHHVRFPDDIAIIGFDVHDKSGLITPGITTVRQPEHLNGKLTAELLLRRLDNQHKEQETREKVQFGGMETGQRTLLSPYLEMKSSC